jgi:hypothetical protein
MTERAPVGFSKRSSYDPEITARTVVVWSAKGREDDAYYLWSDFREWVWQQPESYAQKLMTRYWKALEHYDPARTRLALETLNAQARRA